MSVKRILESISGVRRAENAIYKFVEALFDVSEIKYEGGFYLIKIGGYTDFDIPEFEFLQVAISYLTLKEGYTNLEVNDIFNSAVTYYKEDYFGDIFKNYDIIQERTDFVIDPDNFIFYIYYKLKEK